MAEADGSSTRAPPNLGSRVVVTWAELTVLGLAGGILGTAVGGPPALVVYFATTLLSVGILLYNVNELIRAWVTADA
ncbi:MULTISPECIES: hypothetical protein [Halolamina]|uniref:Uncharacterized protein n=1 Tax=Halolamina pelagica TaxID=699431 RepID=A0A1I5P802_9EURY|nr:MULTISPECIES: hypothetical protein [Halolamina]NHX36681.1 hypothetical protein [Halolamina sp. R1-12]SFP30228.1 hypothetical protein SAMN05216277_102403 [Halolamina pelagica]